MKLKSYLKLYIAAGAFIIACGGCSGGDNGSESMSVDVKQFGSQEQEYVPSTDNYTPHQLDSIALTAVDDLEPDQAVRLLIYYKERINGGAPRLQTIRKFKDVYSIVSGNYGNAFSKAVDNARHSGNIDLAQLYMEFSATLEAADQGAGLPAADTVATDSVPADSVRTDVAGV